MGVSLAATLFAAEAKNLRADKIENLFAITEEHGRMLEAKTLPNGQSCVFCPDNGKLSRANDLEAAAANARYEAAFLQAAANKPDLQDDKRAHLEAAAQTAKYEASFLTQVLVDAIAPDEHARLLKSKSLPNGWQCNYCPDDDDASFP